MAAMKRANLKPLRASEVHFSGRYHLRDKAGNLLLRGVWVDNEHVDYAWLNAGHNDTVTAPVGSRISGYATVFQYTRKDGSADMGLTGAHEIEVSL